VKLSVAATGAVEVPFMVTTTAMSLPDVLLPNNVLVAKLTVGPCAV
jgi:hypothetical protein